MNIETVSNLISNYYNYPKDSPANTEIKIVYDKVIAIAEKLALDSEQNPKVSLDEFSIDGVAIEEQTKWVQTALKATGHSVSEARITADGNGYKIAAFRVTKLSK